MIDPTEKTSEEYENFERVARGLFSLTPEEVEAVKEAVPPPDGESESELFD